MNESVRPIRVVPLSLAAVFFLAGNALAQSELVPAPELPRTVEGFELVDIAGSDLEAGVTFTYEDDSGTRATVRLNRLPPDAEWMRDSIRLVLVADAQLHAFDEAVRNGKLEECTVMANRVLPLSDLGAATGRVLMVTVRSDEGTFVRFVHLFRIQDCTVVSELDLPDDDWQESLKPGFALGLLREIAAAAPKATTVEASGGTDTYYVVDHYDPARDPSEDLKAAVARAIPENRRILLIIGGNWCIWCTVLERFMQESEAIHDMLARHYLIMKVNVSRENENRVFLSAYPEVPGYPHLMILESDGTFLYSQRTDALESGEWYVEDKVVQLLEKWAPGGR
jgi:hypothetical protein